jgi:hypothetical protein
MANDTHNNKLGRLAAALSDSTLDRLRVMARVQAKYIKTPRDKELREAFDKLVEHLTLIRMQAEISNSKKNEPRGLVLIAETGSGKTTSLERLFSTYPGVDDFGQPTCPIKSIVAKAPCTLGKLGRRTLKTLGYPIAAERQIKENVIWEMVGEKTLLTKTEILHFDEIQNITDTVNVIQATILRDTLKSLLNDTENPVGVVLSGLPSVKSFIEEDGQLYRRLKFIEFPRISKAEVKGIHKTVTEHIETAGLSAELADDLVPRLIHAANNAMGVCFEMTTDAIAHALENGEHAVTVRNFAAQFTARAKCGPLANPFLADAWRDIDPTKALIKNPQQYLVEQAKAEAETSAKANKARRKR